MNSGCFDVLCKYEEITNILKNPQVDELKNVFKKKTIKTKC